MSHFDPYDFDIDVDLSPLLGDVKGPTLINARWYELAREDPERAEALQAKIQQTFRNELLHAQWSATSRRALDRRRAVRAPIISRVQIDGGQHMVACDISLSGLRCSGQPTAPVMDIEFKLPGLQFPIDARAEVVSFKDANVIPLIGLRFAWIDRPYLDCIAQYVAKRRDAVPLAA